MPHAPHRSSMPHFTTTARELNIAQRRCLVAAIAARIGLTCGPVVSADRSAGERPARMAQPVLKAFGLARACGRDRRA
eukprot:2483633-Alexandrium_andersonii.AAC.1